MEEVNEFQFGKIYKIVNNVNDDFYVGSTVTTLALRMSRHRASAKTQTHLKMFKAFGEIGVNNFSIELIEDFSCDTKQELRAREDHFIRLLKPNYNSVNAVFNKEKRKEYMTDYLPKYIEKNREEISEYKKKWKEDNKYVYCEVCDLQICKDGKARHERRSIHQGNLIK